MKLLHVSDWHLGRTTYGEPHEVWYRYNGSQLGYLGNNGNSDMSYGQSISDRLLMVTPGMTIADTRSGCRSA